jgi:DNA-binding SARP family transcriptional activator
VPELKVRLFGKLQIQWNNSHIEGFDSSKVQELFCYLLLHRDRPHPRETLASLFWDANSTSQSKKYLRQTLWQLQNLLPDLSEHSDDSLLLVEPDWIRVNPNANLWLDIAEFEEAYKNSHGFQGWQLNAETVHALEKAEKLYADDLLLGWYQDWTLFERERFQNMFLAIMDKLMAYCEAHGKYETGISYGMRIMTIDIARERTHQNLMRLHYLSGDRTAALRQYQRCEQALTEELGVKPARHTKELYETFKADESLDSMQISDDTKPLRPPQGESLNHYLPGMMGQLKEIQGVLANAQQRVQNDIEAIERALKSQA